ncbi:MAG: hypothetical protein K0R65_448 [Crocinitomicaceae bacterium]|jgi:hypothetical protein|nr:hypothetical protein [Crocinitomicaceae bacterium]
MFWRKALKVVLYVAIVFALAFYWISFNLDVKFGMDPSQTKEVLLNSALRMKMNANMYLSIILFSTFGLIILEFMNRKRD